MHLAVDPGKKTRALKDRNLCGKSTHYRIAKEFREKLPHFESLLKNLGNFEINNIVLNTKSDPSKPFSIFKNSRLSSYELLEKDSDEFISKNVFLKSRSLISDDHWQELKSSQIVKTSVYKIKQFKEMFKCFCIEENTKGVFYHISQKIKFFLTRIVHIRKLSETEEIIIALSGDGTNLNNPKLKLFNFGMTVLNGSCSDFYLLGMFKILKESHEEFEIALKEIIAALKKFHLNGILIDEKKYKIKFLSTGDMNYTLHIYGLNGANSIYSCMLCTAPKTDFGNLEKIDQNWPINRSLDEAKSILENLKNFKDNKSRLHAAKGYGDKPLFDFIDFVDIIYCTLHMFLRVGGDKLLDLLVDDIIVIDGNDGKDL